VSKSLQRFHRTGASQKIREKVSAKPVLGKPIGTVKFTFKYFEGTAIELGGLTSDVTGLFISEKAQRDFRDEIFIQAESLGIDIDSLTASSNVAVAVANADQTMNDGGETEIQVNLEDGVDEKELSAIKKAIKDLKALDFADCCRVLLLEENGQKHLIIQVRHLKFLTEYAHNIDTAQWSYIRGLQYEYLVAGQASSLPYPKKLLELGKVYIHIFVPEDEAKSSDADQNIIEKVKNLGAIIPMIPQTGNTEEVLRAKDDEIASANEALKQLREDLAEKTTTTEAAKTCISGLEGNGNLPQSMKKSLGASAYLFMILPSLLIGYFANSIAAPYGWIAGIALGVPLGFGLISWRH